ncbi:hypothetical protein JTB14_025331 [Gonioctena quinquepunctata]|nr:hypothetical protein JTB14_025331 [Gonioctena quinquepunctata]
MMNVQAFARTLRGHLLVQNTLANFIGRNPSHPRKTGKHQQTSDFLDDPPSVDPLDKDPYLRSIAMKFGTAIEGITYYGPTDELCIQYFNMVVLIKEYIHGLLNCCRRMLPYFHAGHFLYAKSCHLYLQLMGKLFFQLTPEDYQRFVEDTYFTMR